MTVDTGDYGPLLFVPLANEPFRRFKAGTKTVEVRQFGPRWHEETVYRTRPVALSRGYSTPDRLYGFVRRVAVSPRVQDMPEWAKAGADLRDVQLHPLKGRPFFDPDRPVLAFEVEFLPDQGIGQPAIEGGGA